LQAKLLRQLQKRVLFQRGVPSGELFWPFADKCDADKRDDDGRDFDLYSLISNQSEVGLLVFCRLDGAPLAYWPEC
jgi:hypothetical protein